MDTTTRPTPAYNALADIAKAEAMIDHGLSVGDDDMVTVGHWILHGGTSAEMVAQLGAAWKQVVRRKRGEHTRAAS